VPVGRDREQPGLRRRRHPLLVLTSGAHRVDETQVAALLGVPRSPGARRVRPRHTGQAIGGVAPIGHPEPIGTLVDVELARYDAVWAAAGHPPPSSPPPTTSCSGSPRARRPRSARPPRPGHRGARGGRPMTDTRPATRVIELPTAWLREHMHEALTIYGLAMGYDSGVVAGPLRLRRPAHRAPRLPRRRRLRETPDGEQLVGFGTATSSRPGSGGTTRCGRPRPADGEEVAARRLRGLRAARATPTTRAAAWGGRLLHALVADLPHPAALLSTPDSDTKAFRLYHADGFVDLAAGYHFPGDSDRSPSSARASRCIRTTGPANS
jgi:hypothetical protein